MKRCICSLLVFFFALMCMAFAKEKAMMGHKSLYDRLGGKDAIRAVTKQFLSNVQSDKRVNAAFMNMSKMRMKAEMKMGDKKMAAKMKMDTKMKMNKMDSGMMGMRMKSLEDKLVDFICQATGGPCKYTGKSMKDAHAGMGISGKQFDAVVDDLVKSLDKFKVPKKEKDELLGLLGPLKKDIVEKP